MTELESLAQLMVAGFASVMFALGFIGGVRQ